MKRRVAVWLISGTLLLAVSMVWYAHRPSVSYAVQTEEAAAPPDAGNAEKAKAEEEEWPEWTDPKEKIVPIISIGTPGVRLGAAQVTGPAERVEKVKSVVQLDARFKKAVQLYIYLPSSELAGLNRVQGVAVTALLEYKLMSF
jgi:hypothetical protein